MNNKIKEYGSVLFGILLSSLSFNLILAPTHLVAGGDSGMAIIVHYLFGMNESLFILVINIILIIISLNFLGKKRTRRTILGALLFPLFVSLTSFMVEYIDFSQVDTILLAIIAGTVSGVGNGLVYRYDFTTGGSDILYQLVEKYLKKPMNQSYIYIDIPIVLLGSIVFGFQSMIYSLIILTIQNTLANQTMLKINNNRSLLIDTESIDKIKELLMNEYRYDVSILNTIGGYTNDHKKMIFCTIHKKDYYPIKKKILEIDKNTFMIVTKSYELKNANKSIRKENCHSST